MTEYQLFGKSVLFSKWEFLKQVLQLPLDKAKLVKILLNFSIVSLICGYFLIFQNDKVSAIQKVKTGFTIATWQSQSGENPTQIIPIFQERHHPFFIVFPLKLSGSLLL